MTAPIDERARRAATSLRGAVDEVPVPAAPPTRSTRPALLVAVGVLVVAVVLVVALVATGGDEGAVDVQDAPATTDELVLLAQRLPTSSRAVTVIDVTRLRADLRIVEARRERAHPDEQPGEDEARLAAYRSLLAIGIESLTRPDLPVTDDLVDLDRLTAMATNECSVGPECLTVLRTEQPSDEIRTRLLASGDWTPDGRQLRRAQPISTLPSVVGLEGDLVVLGHDHDAADAALDGSGAPLALAVPAPSDGGATIPIAPPSVRRWMLDPGGCSGAFWVASSPPAELATVSGVEPTQLDAGARSTIDVQGARYQTEVVSSDAGSVVLDASEDPGVGAGAVLNAPRDVIPSLFRCEAAASPPSATAKVGVSIQQILSEEAPESFGGVFYDQQRGVVVVWTTVEPDEAWAVLERQHYDPPDGAVEIRRGRYTLEQLEELTHQVDGALKGGQLADAGIVGVGPDREHNGLWIATSAPRRLDDVRFLLRPVVPEAADAVTSVDVARTGF